MTIDARRVEAAVSELLAAIGEISPDDMSPREALEALYRLKARAAEIEKDG